MIVAHAMPNAVLLPVQIVTVVENRSNQPPMPPRLVRPISTSGEKC
jgi:hypothetical protein